MALRDRSMPRAFRLFWPSLFTPRAGSEHPADTPEADADCDSPKLPPVLRRFADPVRRHDELVRRVMSRLRATPQLETLIADLSETTDGELFVFGGTVRRALLGSVRGSDVDLMAPNGDERVFRHLAYLSTPHTLNRRGHRRFRTAGIQKNQTRIEQASFY